MTITEQQTITAPAGFEHKTMPDMAVPRETWGTWGGPSCEGVRSYWAPDQGTLLAVDGYEDAGRQNDFLAGDVTPETAWQVISHMTDVLGQIETARQPRVHEVTAEMVRAGRTGIAEVIQAGRELGVAAATMVWAVAAQIDRRDDAARQVAAELFPRWGDVTMTELGEAADRAGVMPSVVVGHLEQMRQAEGQQ